MSEFRVHTGLKSCTCAMCDLINCGALDSDWGEWGWINFSGWARIHMYLLVEREPPVWPGPRRRWAGCLDWFRVMGLALDFDDAEGADDDPAS
jgi:hypothetical protein